MQQRDDDILRSVNIRKHSHFFFRCKERAPDLRERAREREREREREGFLTIKK